MAILLACLLASAAQAGGEVSVESMLREMTDLDRTLPRLAPGERDDNPPEIRPQRDSAGERGVTEGESEQDPRDARPGALNLQVFPPQARVTLDGDFFATGAEISHLHGGIQLSPGVHRIRVSCEGFESRSREVSIQEGTSQTVEIALRRR